MAVAATIDWDGDDIADELKEAAARGLGIAAEYVLGVSNPRVPHEEGTLERSGTTSVDPDELLAAVSYDTPYAVRQHEDLTLHHDDGRRAKYLESAATESAQTVLDLVAAEIRKETER